MDPILLVPQKNKVRLVAGIRKDRGAVVALSLPGASFILRG